MSVHRTQTEQTNREEIIKEGLSYLNDFCAMVVYTAATKASLVYLAMIHHVVLSLYREENQQDIRDTVNILVKHIGQLGIPSPNELGLVIDEEIDLCVSIANWYLTNIALTKADSEGYSLAIDAIDIIINEPAFAKGIINTLIIAEKQFFNYNTMLNCTHNAIYPPYQTPNPQPVWGGGLQYPNDYQPMMQPTLI